LVVGFELFDAGLGEGAGMECVAHLIEEGFEFCDAGFELEKEAGGTARIQALLEGCEGVGVGAEEDRLLEEVGFGGAGEFGQSGGAHEAAADAGGEAESAEGEDGHSHPEGVGTGGVGAVGEGVEEEVGEGVAGEVFVDGDFGGEDEAFGGDAGVLGVGAEAGVDFGGLGEEPEDALGTVAEDFEPALEGGRGDFVGGIKAAEDGARGGQAGLGAGDWGLRSGAFAVVGLVAGEVEDFFRVVDFVFRGDDPGVGEEVMMEGGAHGAGVAEPVDLDGGGAEGEDAGASGAGVAVEVDEDFDAIGSDAFGGLKVGEGGDGDPVRDGGADALLEGVVGIGAGVVGEDFDARGVVEFKDLGEEVAEGMGAQVGAEVADAQGVRRGLGMGRREGGEGAGFGGREFGFDGGLDVAGGGGELEQRVVGEGGDGEGVHEGQECLGIEFREGGEDGPFALAQAEDEELLGEGAGMGGEGERGLEAFLGLRQAVELGLDAGELGEERFFNGEIF
jgi:hypothetical protein